MKNSLFTAFLVAHSYAPPGRNDKAFNSPDKAYNKREVVLILKAWPRFIKAGER
ncbi:MAG: hypothetical protein R6U03_11295 [Gillisia sp.]